MPFAIYQSLLRKRGEGRSDLQPFLVRDFDDVMIGMAVDLQERDDQEEAGASLRCGERISISRSSFAPNNRHSF